MADPRDKDPAPPDHPDLYAPNAGFERRFTGDEAGQTVSQEREERGIPAARKAVLFSLAQGIAASVQATTKPGRERCLLREMVELNLDR